MENKPEGQAKEGKKKPRYRKGLLVLGGIVLVVVAFFAIKAFIEAPRDLGPDLTYIGKADYGNILGFDQLPGANYFFATDMTEEQLEAYIGKTKYVYDTKDGGAEGVDYTYDGLDFHIPGTKYQSSNDHFNVRYYDNVPAVIMDFQLKQTSKSHLVSIDASAYGELRQALKDAKLLGK